MQFVSLLDSGAIATLAAQHNLGPGNFMEKLQNSNIFLSLHLLTQPQMEAFWKIA